MIVALGKAVPARAICSWALLTIPLLASCTVGPEYHAASPGELKVPQAHSTAPDQIPVAVDLRTWWSSFNHPALSGLISTAMAANNDIAIASSRLRLGKL